MINALLLLSLLCQDPEVSVNGRGRRQDGEYELTVSGKGKGLRDHEIVSLKFRRFENRVAWDDRVLTTQPVDDEAARTAVVEKQEFVHQEKFPTAGEVEVVLGLGRPEDGASEARTIQRIFRIASPAETAHAIGADAKGFDAALRGVRSLLEDLEVLKREEVPPMKRQGRLQRRIDWRKNAYRADIARSFLTASARALGLWLEDVENASELERTGARLQAGLLEAGRRHGIPVRVERQGSMLGLYFTGGPIHRMEDVSATDRPRFARVFHRLLQRGVHLPPSPYEAMFLSTAHGDAEIAATLEAFDAALAEEAAG